MSQIRPTITVRRVDVPSWLCFTSGVVFINRKRSGVLIADKPTNFRVSPGEHKVGVNFGFGRFEVSTHDLGKGEQLDLVCGRVKGWTFWKSRLSIWLVCCLLAGHLIAGTCGYLLFPRSYEAVLSFVIRGPSRDSLLFFLGVQRISALKIVGLFLGRMAWGWISRGIEQRVQVRSKRLGELFFLMPLREYEERK